MLVPCVKAVRVNTMEAQSVRVLNMLSVGQSLLVNEWSFLRTLL